MYINFVNMCGTDVEKVVKKIETRLPCNILCEVKAVHLYDINCHDDSHLGWMVKVVSAVGNDPKIHFKELEKAQAFYDFVMDALATDDQFLTIDVLEHGAI